MRLEDAAHVGGAAAACSRTSVGRGAEVAQVELVDRDRGDACGERAIFEKPGLRSRTCREPRRPPGSRHPPAAGRAARVPGSRVSALVPHAGFGTSLPVVTCPDGVSVSHGVGDLLHLSKTMCTRQASPLRRPEPHSRGQGGPSYGNISCPDLGRNNTMFRRLSATFLASTLLALAVFVDADADSAVELRAAAPAASLAAVRQADLATLPTALAGGRADKASAAAKFDASGDARRREFRWTSARSWHRVGRPCCNRCWSRLARASPVRFRRHHWRRRARLFHPGSQRVRLRHRC